MASRHGKTYVLAELGSVWRKLNPGQQAMVVLVYLRKGEPFAQVGAGFDVSATTCWRYVNETVELLARRAPKLREALRKAQREEMAYVIVDGTVRHEALEDRAGVKGLRRRAVAAVWLKLRAAVRREAARGE
jgi:hypothetical protein